MRKLVFPGMAVMFLVLMLVSDSSLAQGFFAAAVICVVLSFIAFLYA